jgi:hypothetical protein
VSKEDDIERIERIKEDLIQAWAERDELITFTRADIKALMWMVSPATYEEQLLNLALEHSAKLGGDYPRAYASPRATPRLQVLFGPVAPVEPLQGMPEDRMLIVRVSPVDPAKTDEYWDERYVVESAAGVANYPKVRPL